MSDHPKEAHRNLKRINICEDIQFDLFHWLAPKKLGLELALLSRRFDALVDTHFNHYRKWALGELVIKSDGIIKSNDDGSEEALPFPQMPLPVSVVGFKSVKLRSFDSDAIAFLQRIGRLLQSDICLRLNIHSDQRENWNAFFASVWPLLTTSAITNIDFDEINNVNFFIRGTRPSILRDCPNLRFVTINEPSLQFPPDESDESTIDQVFCKWLHEPRVDGLPKVIYIKFSLFGFHLEALKTFFLNGTSPVNFIILYKCHELFDDFGPFELVNSMTREQLKCRRNEQIKNATTFLIVRCPIDKNAKQWAEWEDEALIPWENYWKQFDEDEAANDWKVFDISLEDEALIGWENIWKVLDEEDEASNALANEWKVLDISIE